MSEFVGLGVKRLVLSGEGRWVEIKEEIGVAEAKRIESALFRGVQGGQALVQKTDITADDVELMLDATHAFMVKLETYIVDWSFRDVNDKPVKVSSSAIAALKPSTAEEILREINKYLDEVEAERDASPFTKRNSKPKSA